MSNKRTHSDNYEFDKKPKTETIFQLSLIENDDDGHIICRPGKIINDKYENQRTLGKGAYGHVIDAKNTQTGKNVALKVIKNTLEHREAAMHEISIIKKIECQDSNDKNLCLKMFEWFNYSGYICIVFEALGLSIFDFLRENEYEPYTLDEIRHITHQLCHAVSFLHKNHITHNDLKLENVLFVDSAYTTIKKKNREIRRLKCTDIRLIDFGSATRDEDNRGIIVSTIFYRAPEAILQLNCNHACDVWSIGCIIFEMYYGNPLFETLDEWEHLGMMERVLGEIPHSMIAATKTKYFSNGKFDWSTAAEDAQEYCRPLQNYMSSKSENDVEAFDLIKKMLEYEPSHRITLIEALTNPFLERLQSYRRIN